MDQSAQHSVALQRHMGPAPAIVRLPAALLRSPEPPFTIVRPFPGWSC